VATPKFNAEKLIMKKTLILKVFHFRKASKLKALPPNSKLFDCVFNHNIFLVVVGRSCERKSKQRQGLGIASPWRRLEGGRGGADGEQCSLH